MHVRVAHLICKPNFADLRRFALNAHADTGPQCGEAASSFSLPARGMIVGGTWCNKDLGRMAMWAANGSRLASLMTVCTVLPRTIMLLVDEAHSWPCG